MEEHHSHHHGEILHLGESIAPFIGGIGAAVLAGALGCFIVWRRMAYFGDAVAHSAMLGVALGVLLGFSTNFGIWIAALGFAFLLTWLKHNASQATLSVDSWMGILAHGAFALALIMMADSSVDVHDFLFGDVMSIADGDLWWIWLAVGISLLLLAYNWNNLVLLCINEDLARTAKINTFATDLLMTALMATAVTLGIKVVGILLIASMLIVPAATVKLFTASPLATAVGSAGWSAAAVVAGIIIANIFGLPSGPTVVLTLVGVFTIVLVVKR